MDIKLSFKQWCIENDRNDILDRWDYELNSDTPDKVNYKSNKKYYFKCPSGKHESQLQSIQYLPAGKQKELPCAKCNSFAQYIVDNYSSDYFEQIWSKDNTIDPWTVPYKSEKKAIFICQNNSDHVYEMKISYFTKGSKCPKCKEKEKLNNSLGNTYKWIFDIWSDKNVKSPYDYSKSTAKKAWFKCHNGIHADYERSINASSSSEFKCPECMIHKKAYNFEDLTGKKFGELEVLFYDKDRSQKTHQTYWKCKCSCGAIVSAYSASLKDGRHKTCGKGIHHSGENSTNWKGGVTSMRFLKRSCQEYKDWRQNVYKKDYFTCQCCGKTIKEIELHAHHILNMSQHDDMKYSVNNGITLCRDCHYTTVPGSFHNTYGVQNNTPDQLEEYINNKRKQLGINIPFSINEYQNTNLIKEAV